MKKIIKNICSMYLSRECRCSPTSTSNKNKLATKRKVDHNPSQNKSNFDFLLLCSNAPTRPRPFQPITLIYFHHPPIIPKVFPFIFLVVLKCYMKVLFFYKNSIRLWSWFNPFTISLYKTITSSSTFKRTFFISLSEPRLTLDYCINHCKTDLSTFH